MVTIRPSQNVPQGTILLSADLDHPEVQITDDVDGTFIICHPDDEPMLREAFEEYEAHGGDAMMLATAIRKRGGVR